MLTTSNIALVFPGQGAQFVGMGKDIYHAFPQSRRVFERIDETLGFELSKLCFEGPEEELTQTENAQPAIFTVSLACLEAIRDKLHPHFLAGHSLGEYTALAAAGVFDLEEGAKLVRERGRLMQREAQSQKSGMAAIIASPKDIEKICAKLREESKVQIANYNSPRQIVISGPDTELGKAMKLAAEEGSRVVKLKVSAAFHSALMERVAKELASNISKVNFCEAQIPVVSNVTAGPMTGAEEIREDLIKQLLSPVRWMQSVQYMIASGVKRFVEIGPGRVLRGLIVDTQGDADILNLGNVRSLEALLST